MTSHWVRMKKRDQEGTVFFVRERCLPRYRGERVYSVQRSEGNSERGKEWRVRADGRDEQGGVWEVYG